jgi:beta-N-acetylhexosaminidase
VDSTSLRSTEDTSDNYNDAQEAQQGHRSDIPSRASPLARKFIEASDTIKTQSITETPVEAFDTVKTVLVTNDTLLGEFATHQYAQSNKVDIAVMPTVLHNATKLDHTSSFELQETHKLEVRQKMTWSKAILLAGLLLALVVRAASAGHEQFLGSQGWAYVLGASPASGDQSLLTQLGSSPHARLGAGKLTPQHYIDLILHNMTLDQKLGQMMIVQFLGPSYSFELTTMLSQYNAGAVLLSSANNNIVDKMQLKDLIQQMQSNSTIPPVVATDQEGGAVNRLAALDGPRPSATTIGNTNDPNQAMAAGVRDAQDLSSYGINLNLAPVVDVTSVYNAQLSTRTYGDNAELVTRMAAAYLQGLQQSGKVLGTLKHFPGLGDVAVDPHSGVPLLLRSLSDLESIDWAPYHALIQQGNVHAIMVTHEIVTALDDTKPSSLSPKVVKHILRDELAFQGVIITDSLTMEGITAYYTEAQAAAMAIEAGSDLLMGASTPSDMAMMIGGIKQALHAGDITQQAIDDSVRRILMMKYAMGLLPMPAQ